MANDTSVTAHRGERILAYMVASAIGLSLLSFIAVIIGTATGLKGDDFAGGIWSTVFLLPLIGLPLGLLLLIALLVVSGLRRGREAKDAGE